jgi:hypothetical protein
MIFMDENMDGKEKNFILNIGNKRKVMCRNPSFGLATKAKGLQGCGPRGSLGVKAKRSYRCGPRRSLGVTSHTPRNVRK